MPEGDSVFRQAAELHRALAGKELTSSDFRVPAFATVDLRGFTVDAVVARGKHLMIRIGDLSVHSHLKMEGIWHLYAQSPAGTRARWRRPGHTARCVLTTAEVQAVGFSLGELQVISRSGEDEVLAHLGPDLLGTDWDPAEAARRMMLRPERAIGVALLDQSTMAGVGNVFRSEICFLSGVHPAVPVGDLLDLERVIEMSHRLLQVNRLRPQRCTTGTPGSGVQYWVYGRRNKSCLRCRTRIRESELGEERLRKAAQPDRVIYFCPACQPQGPP